jgi:DNA-binding CsgD family transcriptional regulator
MTELAEADLRRALTLVGDLAAAPVARDYYELGIEGIADLIGTTGVAFNHWRFEREAVRVVTYVGLTEDRVKRGADLRTMARRLPWLRPRPDHLVGGTVLSLSDFVHPRRLAQTEAYDVFYRPLKINYQLGLSVPVPQHCAGGFLIDRDDRDFSQYERALCAVVAPHLAGIYRNLVARERLIARVHKLEGVLREGSLAPSLDEVAPVLDLTPRELEVLDLVARGLTNPQIGTRLYISPRTVQKHLDNVYGKLDVRSRTAAATRYLALHRLPVADDGVLL